MVERVPYAVYGEEANVLIPLLLGASSILDDFAAAARDASPGAAASSDAEGDALLAAALGLISRRRTLGRWARVASQDHDDAQGHDDARASADLSMR
jgi:hypothetical protein